MQVRMQMEVKKQRAGVTPQYRSVLPGLNSLSTFFFIFYSLQSPPRLSLALQGSSDAAVGRCWISLDFLTSLCVVQWDAVGVFGAVP
jgi:hypothetical protein